jgi:hypothetical protein
MAAVVIAALPVRQMRSSRSLYRNQQNVRLQRQRRNVAPAFRWRFLPTIRPLVRKRYAGR